MYLAIRDDLQDGIDLGREAGGRVCAQTACSFLGQGGLHDIARQAPGSDQSDLIRTRREDALLTTLSCHHIARVVLSITSACWPILEKYSSFLSTPGAARSP